MTYRETVKAMHAALRAGQTQLARQRHARLCKMDALASARAAAARKWVPLEGRTRWT